VIRFLAIPLLLLATACAGPKIPEPRIVIQEVKVPVAAPCVPESYDPFRPAYVDSDENLRGAADAAERYQFLWAGRLQRMAREKENEAVIAGCPRGSVK
jgi:hypothetical protein